MHRIRFCLGSAPTSVERLQWVTQTP